MGQFLYERPREKLRNRGVASLGLVELLQLIVGSGSAQLSGARVAREIECVLKGGPVSYDVLVSIRGVGDAKACQILAALEIGGRIKGDG